MRISAFGAVVFLAFFLLLSPPAFALTLDSESGMNADGSAKFSDPDDQKPAFMLGAPDQPNTPRAFGQETVSPGLVGGSDNMHSMDPQNSGPDAFDRSFSQK